MLTYTDSQLVLRLFKPISTKPIRSFLHVEDDESHDVLGGGFEQSEQFFLVLFPLLRGNDSTSTDHVCLGRFRLKENVTHSWQRQLFYASICEFLDLDFEKPFVTHSHIAGKGYLFMHQTVISLIYTTPCT